MSDVQIAPHVRNSVPKRAGSMLPLCLSVLVLITGTAACEARRVRLAQERFDIPNPYLSRMGPLPEWLEQIVGLDDASRDVGILIGADEAANAIPGYQPYDGRYRADILARIHVLTDEERHRYENPRRFADIWNASGSYRNRVIEYDVRTATFRVSRDIEYPIFWDSFTVSPERSPRPDDITTVWLARCYASTSPLTMTGKHESCGSYAKAGNIAIEFNLSGRNLNSVPALRSHLLGLVERWRVPGDVGKSSE